MILGLSPVTPAAIGFIALSPKLPPFFNLRAIGLGGSLLVGIYLGSADNSSLRWLLILIF